MLMFLSPPPRRVRLCKVGHNGTNAGAWKVICMCIFCSLQLGQHWLRMHMCCCNPHPTQPALAANLTTSLSTVVYSMPSSCLGFCFCGNFTVDFGTSLGFCLGPGTNTSVSLACPCPWMDGADYGHACSTLSLSRCWLAVEACQGQCACWLDKRVAFIGMVRRNVALINQSML